MYVFLMLSFSPKIISKGLLQCGPLHWQELSGFHVVVLHWQKNWYDECFVLPSMDKRVCVVIPEFDECFLLVLFIYLFLCGPPYHRWRISLHDWNIWNCGCGCSKKSLFTSQSLPSFFSFWNAEVLFTVRISERVVRAVFIAHTVCK